MNINVVLIGVNVALVVLFLLTAGLGILLVRLARDRMMRWSGYAMAVVYGILGVTLPVFWLIGLMTDSSDGSDTDLSVRACSSFPTQRAAQLFYDHARDEEWADSAWLDFDGDGIACEGATFAETGYFTMRFGDVIYVFETTSASP